MISLSMIVLLSLIIAMAMLLITLATSEKSIKEREKMTPFECGFSPFKKSRNSFSLRFFMITLIFLIFDMEIALILPMGVLYHINSLICWALVCLMVILILLAGILHEWKNGVLDWME